MKSTRDNGVLRRFANQIFWSPIFLTGGAAPAAAHGFGQRYDLPIPLSLYLWGAGATVAFSFVVFALFLNSERAVRPTPIRTRPVAGRWRSYAKLIEAGARASGVVAFSVTILAGLFGNQNPLKNIAPVMVWIITWVGISFLSPLIGNVWQFLNPWDTLFRVAERLFRRVRRRSNLALHVPYPPRLGVWPGFVLFIMFAWLELVWSGRSIPAELAVVLMIYSAITWSGMFVFGRESWLRRGEIFTLVFGIFARFAALQCRRGEECIVELRPPAVGLLLDRPLSASMTALVIALLATVTFDGFLETPLWARVDAAVLDMPPESILWTVFNLREDQALRLVRTVALPAFVGLFTAGYLLVCARMAALSSTRDASSFLLARSFVLTLVPISLAYHIAHYFSYLFVGGQYIIPLLSDPFGFGWNLFGTASYQVDIGFVGPRLQWYVAVTAIVLGHIVAVYLSHVAALRIFRHGRSALITQIPMLVLMVGYTMISLWILSQPIVETGAG